MPEYFKYTESILEINEGCSYGPRQRIDAHRGTSSNIEPADVDGLRRQAFDIGWDFAMYGLRPENGVADVLNGYLAGFDHFGKNGVIKTDLYSRKWLRLRASANSRQRIFDKSVTPEFLREIVVPYCPITRMKLEYPDHMSYVHVGEVDNDAVWTVDRLNNAAGYIDGNLVVMSRLANSSKHTFGFDECRELSIAAEKERDGVLGGLNAAEWARLAYLTAIVDDKATKEEVGCLPLVCIIPNYCQIRCYSSIVQLELMRAVCTGSRDLGKKVKVWCGAMPSKKLRHMAEEFAHILACIFMTMSKKADLKETNARWVFEDAWTNPIVWKAWSKLARHISPSQMSDIAIKLHPTHEDAGTWEARAGIDSRGYSRANDVDFDVSFGPLESHAMAEVFR